MDINTDMNTFEQNSKNFSSTKNSVTYGEYKVTLSNNIVTSESSTEINTLLPTEDTNITSNESVSFSKILPAKFLPPIRKGENSVNNLDVINTEVNTDLIGNEFNLNSNNIETMNTNNINADFNINALSNTNEVSENYDNTIFHEGSASIIDETSALQNNFDINTNFQTSDIITSAGGEE